MQLNDFCYKRGTCSVTYLGSDKDSFWGICPSVPTQILNFSYPLCTWTAICARPTLKSENLRIHFFWFRYNFPWFWVVIFEKFGFKWRIHSFKDEFECFPRGWGYLKEICNIWSEGKHFFFTDQKLHFSCTNSRSRALASAVRDGRLRLAGIRALLHGIWQIRA